MVFINGSTSPRLPWANAKGDALPCSVALEAGTYCLRIRVSRPLLAAEPFAHGKRSALVS